MSKPMTNAHIHIFDSRCAPERFFRVLPSSIIRSEALPLKNFLSSKVGKGAINLLSQFASSIKDRGSFARYLAFTKIGSLPSQCAVFKMALDIGSEYDPSIRLIGLTMNMDYMDSQESSALKFKNFATQLEEVKDIKRYNHEHFFPFLGVDPRHRSGAALRDWVSEQLSIGHQQEDQLYPYFYGIKIYPALGFFPFDAALDELYAYAQEYGIPIMTHCTRGGSQYIGDYIENLIPRSIASIMMRPAKETDAFQTAEKEIQARIDEYYKRGWVKNSNIGDNDLACDLFTHPQNYIPVLEKFPKLKICIAHMGGIWEFQTTEELYHTNWLGTYKPQKKYKELAKIREVDTVRWLDRLREMMQHYPSLFTDVSYTVSYFDQDLMVERLTEFAETLDESDTKLGHRILFGTDFFMTEQEKKEADLYGLIKNRKELEVWLDGFCRENVERYVRFS